jgi:hypothetical protein
MSRNAVLAAIGYPPQHATPSLSSDEWMYWATRYDRFISISKVETTGFQPVRFHLPILL